MTEDFEKADAFSAARAAVAASGTVALELAIAGVPMVMAYRVNTYSAHIAKYLLRVPYVNLINLLLNKPIVPEIIQNEYMGRLSCVNVKVVCSPTKLTTGVQILE